MSDINGAQRRGPSRLWAVSSIFTILSASMGAGAGQAAEPPQPRLWIEVEYLGPERYFARYCALVGGRTTVPECKELGEFSPQDIALRRSELQRELTELERDRRRMKIVGACKGILDPKAFKDLFSDSLWGLHLYRSRTSAKLLARDMKSFQETINAGYSAGWMKYLNGNAPNLNPTRVEFNRSLTQVRKGYVDNQKMARNVKVAGGVSAVGGVALQALDAGTGYYEAQSTSEYIATHTRELQIQDSLFILGYLEKEGIAQLERKPGAYVRVEPGKFKTIAYSELKGFCREDERYYTDRGVKGALDAAAGSPGNAQSGAGGGSESKSSIPIGAPRK